LESFACLEHSASYIYKTITISSLRFHILFSNFQISTSLNSYSV